MARKINLNTVKSKWTLSCKEIYRYFDNDIENEDVIKLFLLYIARDERFETAVPGKSLSLDKGIILHGRPGTGKTMLFRIMQRCLYYLKSEKQFKRFNMRELCNGYHTKPPVILAPDAKHWFVDELGLLGREQLQFYGNKMVVGDELIGIRYDMFQQGYVTHLTTNLSYQGLVDNYDERTISRLTEMCNFIPLDGTDRRVNAKPAPKELPVTVMPDMKQIRREWWQHILLQFNTYKITGKLEISGALKQFELFENAGLILLSEADKWAFIDKAKDELKRLPIVKDKVAALSTKALIAGIVSGTLTDSQQMSIRAHAALLAIKAYYDKTDNQTFMNVINELLK